MTRRTIVMLAVALSAFLVSPAAWADLFRLAGGGQVEGELLNPEEKPRKSYAVRLASGGTVKLAAQQVEEHVALRSDEEEYQRIRPQFPDTVEGQWALAEWCRERKLLEQRDTHLERVVELAPEHAEARRALGYSRVDGKWARQEDVMAERGYIRYKGRYRTQQEIDLLESKRKQEVVERDWFQKINRWRGWLAGDKAEQARQAILGLEDPAAAKALIQGLRADRDREVRILYAEAIAKLNTPEGIKALATAALEDGDQEVRLSCLDLLQKKPNPDAVAYFCAQLRHKENWMVQRAGEALGRMKDRSAIPPLIDALVTVHKHKIKGNPNQYSAGFGSGAPGGFSFGNSTKIITENKTNQTVLDALVTLTGQNFNFAQSAWRNWYAMQKKGETIDGRRD